MSSGVAQGARVIWTITQGSFNTRSDSPALGLDVHSTPSIAARRRLRRERLGRAVCLPSHRLSASLEFAWRPVSADTRLAISVPRALLLVQFVTSHYADSARAHGAGALIVVARSSRSKLPCVDPLELPLPTTDGRAVAGSVFRYSSLATSEHHPLRPAREACGRSTFRDEAVTLSAALGRWSWNDPRPRQPRRRAGSQRSSRERRLDHSAGSCAAGWVRSARRSLVDLTAREWVDGRSRLRFRGDPRADLLRPLAKARRATAPVHALALAIAPPAAARRHGVYDVVASDKPSRGRVPAFLAAVTVPAMPSRPHRDLRTFELASGCPRGALGCRELIWRGPACTCSSHGSWWAHRRITAAPVRP